MSKKWFSFIELIIVVSILLLLAVIWVSISSTYKENTENTRISADIVTLKNSFTQFKENTQGLPLPWGNLGYYDTDSNYMHSEAGAFWVHWFLTENILPKNFINYLPIDPRTHQYYAYGKTITNDAFEVWGVVKDNLDYKSSIEGNYNGEGGPLNLIREYNGPDFVFNESIENFPYNPEERVVTWKITSYSGNITINGSVSAKDQILAFILKEGDIINVPQNGYANIYFADGSSSTLGSTSSPSELKIAKMTFKEENNLFTKIQLALSIGSLWTQAAKLDDNSEFEVYTTDTTAAVRGTVFSLSKLAASTNITVESGKVKVAKLSWVSSFDTLTQNIASDTLEVLETPIVSSNVTEMAEEDWESVTYIDASTWKKWLDILSSSVPPTPGTVTLPIKRDISNNVKIKIISIDGTSLNTRSVKLYLPQRILGAEKIVLQTDSWEIYSSTALNISWSTLTIGSTTSFTKESSPGLVIAPQNKPLSQLGDKVKVKLCLWGKCTRYIDILFVSWKEIVNVDTQTEAESRSIDACKLSFINPLNQKCAINPFANELYELVWLADFTNQKSQGSIYSKDGMIEASWYTTSTELDTSDSRVQWIKLKDGKLNYNLSKLSLWDNYILQMRVKWKGIIDANGSFIILFKDEVWKYIKFFPGWNPMDSISLYSSTNSLTTNAPIAENINADIWYDLVLYVNNKSIAWTYVPKYKFIISKTDGAIVYSVTPPTSATQDLFSSISKIYLGDWSTSKFWKWTIQWLRVYRKITPPKEGTNKDYIQRVGAVTQYIWYPSCTPSASTVAVPWSLTISCTVTGTIGYTSLNYTWTKTAGTGTPSPNAWTITNFSLPVTTNITWISAAGTNTYKFEVSDASGNKRSTNITVTSTSNTLPIVNAGTPQSFHLSTKNYTSLYWTASDPDWDPLTYLWTVSWPTSVSIVSPTSLSTTVNGFKWWLYTFTLTATDTKWWVKSSTVTVDVDAAVSGYGCGSCPWWLSYESDDGQTNSCSYNVMVWDPKEWSCTNVIPEAVCKRQEDVIGCHWENKNWSWTLK